MTRRTRIGLLAILIAFAPVGSGLAEVSQEEYTQALDLFQGGKYREAETAFRRILPHSTDPAFTRSLLWNIARCLEERKATREAIAAYEKFANAATTDEERERVRLKLAKVRALVVGSVAVQCTAQSAQIALEHPPGTLTAPRPCPTQFTDIDAERVVVVGDFGLGEPVRQMVNITPGRTVDVTLTPTAPVVSGAGSWPWATVGTGAALVGAGIGFYSANQSNLDKLRDDPGNQDLRDAVDRDRTLAIGSYVLGGTALAAGLAWVIHAALDDSPSTATRLTPMGVKVSF